MVRILIILAAALVVGAFLFGAVLVAEARPVPIGAATEAKLAAANWTFDEHTARPSDDICRQARQLMGGAAFVRSPFAALCRFGQPSCEAGAACGRSSR
jgi:hypothetical protein